MSVRQELKEKVITYLRTDAKANPSAEPEYHAVFSCGTVVRFKVDNPLIEFKFDKDHGYAFPYHRTKSIDDICQMKAQLRTYFRSILEKTKKEVHPMIHTAYQRLMFDGYPYPGGEGADRDVLPFGKDFGIVVFVNRSLSLFNIIVPAMEADTLQKMIDAGGEARRCDYIDPKLILIISPTMEIIFDNINII
jgi:hypothetical protein